MPRKHSRSQQLALPGVPPPSPPPPPRERPRPPRRRRRGRSGLQLGLPEVPLRLRQELQGLPPAPLAVVACRREGQRLRVRVVSGGDLGAFVLFPKGERREGRRWTVETLIPTRPRRGRGYYRAAGEIRRLEEADEQKD